MRILIADDDGTSRLMLRAMATKLGHECLVAQDGTSAWELLSSENIDVLLTDWMMPGLNGPDLCRRVREDLDGYVYIVLVTALGDPEQVLKGMTAGADDYLIKPVDPFAVQTRLVAAERVTELHRQLDDTRDQLERANQELLGRSLTDALTGLGNRRRMEEDLDKVHAAAVRAGDTFGVALFDIDHFKRFNDHYGHLAGDDALRLVARCMGETMRAGESAYRFGGEEFLVLLRDSSLDDAEAVAGRIRAAVHELSLPHEARPTPPPLLTVSAGVAAWSPASGLSVDQLLEQADTALFVAKSGGRNQVQVAGGVSAAV